MPRLQWWTDTQPVTDSIRPPQTRPSHNVRDEPTSATVEHHGIEGQGWKPSSTTTRARTYSVDVLLIQEPSITVYQPHVNHSAWRLYRPTGCICALPFRKFNSGCFKAAMPRTGMSRKCTLKGNDLFCGLSGVT